jgi:hypothetical protein
MSYHWQDWFRISPEKRMQPGATVTALAPRQGHIDLFATDGDGAVWSTWWEAGPNWQEWRPIYPDKKMQPGATVTALVPRQGHIDLFTTGGNGAVWSTWWEAAPNWQEWYVVAPKYEWAPAEPQVATQPGAAVTALVPRQDHIDLFVTGADGTVWSTWWDAMAIIGVVNTPLHPI